MFPRKAVFGQDEVCNASSSNRRDNGGGNRAAIEGVLRIRFFVFATNDERAEKAHDDANTCDDKRQSDSAQLTLFRRPKRGAENGRTDNRTDIRFEQVGAHTGDVADVVADVIGDNSRVTRIVFGDSGFDFTDKVGADVGRFRIDTTANASK